MDRKMQLTQQIWIQTTPEQEQVLRDLSVKQMMKKDSYQTGMGYAERPTPIYSKEAPSSTVQPVAV